jgi:DNA-directed RNA polymerase subunit RPC12/RpoP
MEDNMFFIGIFGIQNKEKEIKYLNNISCNSCNSESGAKLIKSYNFFHFFFIPLFKWNEKYYVICSNCSGIFEIPQEKGKRIENGEDVEITYWDLKTVETGHYNYGYTAGSKCSHCGRTVEPHFEYCPYCGARLRN